MKIVAQALGTVAAALGVATAGANVGQAATINLNSAVLTGGASLIADDGRIKFDPNIAGETATFTLQSIVGAQYSIQITGQNNQSSSFFQFLIDPDGPGTLSGFVAACGVLACVNLVRRRPKTTPPESSTRPRNGW